MKNTRLKPEERREEILQAAAKLAAAVGLDMITRDAVARSVGVTGPAVQYHFKCVGDLKEEVARRAIAEEDLPVVAQLLATRNPLAAGMSPVLRLKALNSLA